MITFFRTIILYLVVLFTLRIMGKSELSNMTPFQMVIVFMIAELASIPLDSPDKSILTGIIAIITLLFLEMVLSFLTMKSSIFKRLINGRPSILIENGNINVKEMKKLRITVNELFEALRIGGSFSIAEVEYAILETSGAISIVEKNKEKKLPLILVQHGKKCKHNLEKLKICEADLNKQICDKGLSSIKDIFVAFTDGDGNLHVYPYPKGHESFTKEI